MAAASRCLCVASILLCFATACSVRREALQSSEIFDIGNKQVADLARKYRIDPFSPSIPRLVARARPLEGHLGVIDRSVRYYVIATDLPIALTTIDGRLFLAAGWLDDGSPLHLTDNELAAILAHELAHIGENHYLHQVAEHSFRYSLHFDARYSLNIVNTDQLLPYAAINGALAYLERSKPDYYESHRKALEIQAAEALAGQWTPSGSVEVAHKSFDNVIDILDHKFSLEDEMDADRLALAGICHLGITSSALGNVLRNQLSFLRNHPSNGLEFSQDDAAEIAARLALIDSARCPGQAD
jgi:hypothetical protein